MVISAARMMLQCLNIFDQGDCNAKPLRDVGITMLHFSRPIAAGPRCALFMLQSISYLLHQAPPSSLSLPPPSPFCCIPSCEGHAKSATQCSFHTSAVSLSATMCMGMHGSNTVQLLYWRRQMLSATPFAHIESKVDGLPVLTI